eukprot:scaffold25.g5124.t1
MFKKGKKRRQAQEEAEALYQRAPNSALCIALAKMHMTVAVEQALKLTDDQEREAAVLECLHRALEYAVHGATQFLSIQCVVLCVFTLHCCRGRGSTEQKAARQGWHAALADRLPAGEKAAWAGLPWVDPRIESHSTADRFGFEWSPKGNHPTLESWAEAVRDDWLKFMHKSLIADRMDFSVLERLPTKNPDTLRDLLAEVQQPADRRLAGTVTPLNNADKEAVRQRLDALDHRRLAAQQAAAATGAAAGGGAGGGAAAAAPPLANGAAGYAGGGSGGGRGPGGAPLPLPPPPALAPPHLGVQQWLPPAHSVAVARQRAKAEQKRLQEQHQRAQQRAAAIREYLHRKLDGLAAAQQAQQAAAHAAHAAAVAAPAAAAEAAEAATRLLCETARMPLRALAGAVQALAAARELTPAEADLAAANLRRLAGGGEGGEPAHVWYADLALVGGGAGAGAAGDAGSKAEAKGYAEMERALMEQQRQNWQLFDAAGQLVCRDVEGWQSVVSTLLTRPVLLREPQHDLAIDSFCVDPDVLTARVYPEDLLLLEHSAGQEGLDMAESDDEFSDALSKQHEPLGPLGTPGGGGTGAGSEGEPPAAAAGAPPPPPPAAEEPAAAGAAAAPPPAVRPGGGGSKPLLRRVMDFLNSQEAAAQQQEQQAAPEPPPPQPPQPPPQQERGGRGTASDGCSTPEAGDGPTGGAKEAAATAREAGAGAGTAALQAQQAQLDAKLRRLCIRARGSTPLGVDDLGPRQMREVMPEGEEQGRQFYREWIEEGVGERHMDFLNRLAEAAKNEWIRDLVEQQLSMRGSLARRRPAGAVAPPPRGKAPGAASLAGGGGGRAGSAPPPGGSSSGSSSGSGGFSWGSSCGGSTPRLLEAVSTELLDMYVRELLHNTQPCLDAALGLYPDGCAEVEARMEAEDRLGDMRVDQMVRKAFVGHCMMQIAYALHLGQARREGLAQAAHQLRRLVERPPDVPQMILGFVTSMQTSAEAEEAYARLLATEQSSQGRVMSRPVSACARVLAPILLQACRAGGGGGGEQEQQVSSGLLGECKVQLARMAVCGLRHLQRRGRLMEGIMWQVNSFVLSTFERLGESAPDPEQRTHFMAAGPRPLPPPRPVRRPRAPALRPSPRPQTDILVESDSVGQVEEDERGERVLGVKPCALAKFVSAAQEVAAAAAAAGVAGAACSAGAGRGGAAAAAAAAKGSTPPPAGRQATAAAAASDQLALLAEYASGATDVQRALLRLAAAAGAGGGGGAPGAAAAAAAERARLAQHLHRLLYLEAVLGQLMQRCEDTSDGLEATAQVLRIMSKGLDEFIAGTLQDPLPPAPPLNLEAQLRDAQHCLAAADCAQAWGRWGAGRLRLALMLANEKLRAHSYAEALQRLQGQQAALAALPSSGGGGDGGGGGAGRGAAAAAGGAARDGEGARPRRSPRLRHRQREAVERFSKLHAEMQEEAVHDQQALAQLGSSLTNPAGVPLVKSIDLENLQMVDSVLAVAQYWNNPALQASYEQYRQILGERRQEAQERLEQVKGHLLTASRQLEHQRSQLGVLLEWCHLRQLALIGQMRARLCAHSVLDQLVDVLLRVTAVQRWEPQLLELQEGERQANMEALQQELDAEQAEQAKRAAKAEKRRAQKARKAAAAEAEAAAAAAGPEAEEPAAGAGGGAPAADRPAAAAQPRPEAAPADKRAAPAKAGKAARRAAALGAGAGAEAGGGAKGKGGAQQSAQQVAYERMLEEFGIDREAADFAQQLATRQQRGAAAAALPPPLAPASKPAPPAQAPRPASAPGARAAAPPPPREVMRIVGFYGDWLCGCGEVQKLWDTCACGQQPPCRDWVRGICKYGACRFPHPPFDLPDTTTIPHADRIAKPAPDAPLYRKGAIVVPRPAAPPPAKAAPPRPRPASAGAAVAASAPAVNAWQRPLAATAAAAAATPAPTAAAAPAAPAPATPGLPLSPALAAPAAPAPSPAVDVAATFPSLAAALTAASQPAVPVPTAPAPLLPLAAADSTPASGGGGWDPIAGGSGWTFGSDSLAAAATSAPSSRSVTPALGGGGGGLAPSPGAGPLLGGYGGFGGGGGGGWGTRLGPAAPAEQRGFHLPPSLMHGLDMGADADLAALLGPIAADLGADGGTQPNGGAQPDGGAQPSPHRQLLAPGGGAAFGGLPRPPHLAPAPPSPQRAAPPAPHAAFLAVILQALWHCLDFRQQVLAWPEPVYKADPVVCAVRNLFVALSTEPRQRDAAAAPGPGAVAAAGELAEALAGQLAAAGGLPDAGEVLLAIYERIREATALRLLGGAVGGGLSLGRLVRAVEDQTTKTCDRDAGGCGMANSVKQLLEWPPRVASLQLAWQSPREAPADIAATLRQASDCTRTCARAGAARYRLRAMVGVYGGAATGFALDPESRRWVAFDSRAAAAVGAWADVLRKCEAGRIQPCVLFYTAR